MTLKTWKSNMHLAAKTAEERLAIAKSSTIFKSGIVEEHRVKTTEKGGPVLEPRFTGKVWIEKDKGQYELLEDAHFSNADCKVYTSSGDLYPNMEQFNGRKWGMRFKIRDWDKHGKEHEFESEFLCPMPYGMFGEIDWKGFSESEQWEAFMGIKNGVFAGYDDPYLKRFLSGGAGPFIAYVSPKRKIMEVRPYILFLSFALLVDDHLDNNTLFQKTLSWEELTIIKDKFCEVLYGHKEPEEQTVDFDFPPMIPICRHILDLREYALKWGKTYEIGERFLKDVEEYLNALIVNNCQEWNDFKAACKTGTHHRAHLKLRRFDTACMPTYTMCLIAYENRLPKHIHYSHLWQYFRDICTDHITYTNDLLSHRKECADEETCNTLYTRHVDEGMDFIEAMESCVKDANEIAIDMWEIGQWMLKVHNQDKELADAVEWLLSCELGHLPWYNYALRYHNGIVFDAVIHHDDMTWTLEDGDLERLKERLAKQDLREKIDKDFLLKNDNDKYHDI